ncbi:MAG: hypothetical protein ABI612_18765 [Betaproteobacteria bacterium]
MDTLFDPTYSRTFPRWPIMATMSPLPQPAFSTTLLRLAVQVLGALLLSVIVAIAASPAQAQIRPIPANARLATLKLGVFPDAVLNGKAIRLGPGARIYNRDNIIIIPSTLKDVTMVVAFATGSLGEVVSAWILTDQEIKQIRARPKASG